MRINLKFEIYKQFGSQCDAAKVFDMREDRLSQIIRGRRAPTEAEKRVICEKLRGEESALFRDFGD